MTGDEALAALVEARGILTSYDDLSGQRRTMSRDSQLCFLRANGIDVQSETDIRDALAVQQTEAANRLCPKEIVTQDGAPLRLDLRRPAAWHLVLDGEEEPSQSGRETDSISLPDLPIGLHQLFLTEDAEPQRTLIAVAPTSLPSVRSKTGQDRIWGITTALYGLRSDRNAGLGDYADLAALAQSMSGRGARFTGINPVHDLGWSAPDVISPYSPSHRGFLNTLHVALDRIPGLESDGVAQEIAAQAVARSAAARGADLVDYAAVRAIKPDMLETLFARFQRAGHDAARTRFARYAEMRGPHLHRYAQFELLAERHGENWQNWPETLRAPQSQDVAQTTEGAQDRLEFHKWLQWLADCQLAQAQDRAQTSGDSLGLYLDLAVGARRGGAETWCEQDAVATGVSIGAPPDQLSPEGQKWNLAAYSPTKLHDTAYRSFRQILRENMCHAAILRIDHILGLNRNYWIPDGGGPGGYIRQPFEMLLALVAIEAHRAGTIVVGEDLGLVPDGFRERTAERGLYGYAVLQYEKDRAGQFRKPEDLRAQSLACFGTHDTPTMKGFWVGRDISLWQEMGWINEDHAGQARQSRQDEKRALLALDAAPGDPACDLGEVSPRLHGLLARSSSAMVSVQLDDVFMVEEAQNLPGTIDAHPNWRRKCPIAVEEIEADPRLSDTARIMNEAGR